MEMIVFSADIEEIGFFVGINFIAFCAACSEKAHIFTQRQVGKFHAGKHFPPRRDRPAVHEGNEFVLIARITYNKNNV